MTKGSEITFSDEKESGEESVFLQDAKWAPYIDTCMKKKGKWWCWCIVVAVPLILFAVIPCIMWPEDCCKGINMVMAGSIPCPSKGTADDPPATDATVPTTQKSDLDEPRPTTSDSPDPVVPEILSPEEALLRQKKEQDSLGCAPRAEVKLTRELLHPEDSLPDNSVFYPKKIIINQCSDKTSICPGKKRCLPTKNGEEAKKFFLAVFQSPSRAKEIVEKVAYNIKEHTSCSCQ